MATDIYLKRTLRGFEPASAIDYEAMQTIPLGKEVRAKLTRPRSVPHHRMFFAQLKLVVDNTDDYHDAQDLLTAIKLRLGMVERIKIIGSNAAHIIPRSINFQAMDQGEFNEFYKAAMKVIVTEVIPGLDPKELEREAEQIAA